jgi:hypothetical protein
MAGPPGGGGYHGPGGGRRQDFAAGKPHPHDRELLCKREQVCCTAEILLTECQGRTSKGFFSGKNGGNPGHVKKICGLCGFDTSLG